MREKEHNHKNEDCSEGGRERCARTALFVDERLRRTTAHWQAATESSEQVRRRECQIFLVSVESSAVLSDEHPTNRSRLDRAQKKASKGERKQFIQVMPVNGRQSQRRQSLRHGANELHAARLEGKRRCGNNTSDYHEERDGLVLEKNLSKDEERQRNSSNQK